ncbi:MAG: UDP-N-acetylmuramate--L-alanine ligase [Sphingobacteriales bacterium]|nr:MAG: UDP-N-acetylmuramate--L-alanine ligase [Sphingobacteriales bacterium]
MNLNDLKRVYFIGAGGIGMSALARFFNERGVVVAGYDKTRTVLTSRLAEEGILIHYSDDVELLDKRAELVVYTPAIPAGHAELNWYRENNYPVYKRSDVLQWITEKLFSVTVAGTHGKTTTSTMISYLLTETGYGCNAFLGGISVNFESNYWSSENQVAVIEADEYDRSFLKLKPDVAVLTSMDPDHLDIYGTVEEMEAAFIQYTNNLKPEGRLLVKHGLKRSGELGGIKTTYSLQNNEADAYAANITQRQGGYIFDLFSPFGMVSQLHLNVGGMHNVENAVAAVTVALMLGIDAAAIKQALEGFRGVRRRFEYVVRNEQMVYIDDYAHHPEELESLIKSAKRLFPKMKCVVAFQPHLFTRTRDLADGFAHSLDLADEIILLPIYPAREEPIEGVTSEMIKEKMANKACTILSKEGVIAYVTQAKPELFITAGAGDIDQLAQPLKEIMENR